MTESEDTYQVEIENSAAKALIKIQRADQARIALAIQALAINPRPDGAVKLAGSIDAFRICVGNYRVIYAINDTVRIVTITRIAHRREVYRSLT